MDTCQNCERTIGNMETPRVLLGRVVCPECDGRLRAQLVPSAPAAAIPLHHSKRIPAAILALFLGGLGIHRLYLGQVIGIVYLLFFWTFIPAAIALVEGIVFLCMSDADFIARYQASSTPNSTVALPPPRLVPAEAEPTRAKSFRLS